MELLPLQASQFYWLTAIGSSQVLYGNMQYVRRTCTKFCARESMSYTCKRAFARVGNIAHAFHGPPRQMRTFKNEQARLQDQIGGSFVVSHG
jgi:hypothetical protein